jgi:predicted nucleic acid-binding protein
LRFVDSTVFVYHMAADPVYGNDATAILTRIEGGERAATSTLVASQVCAYLRWRKRPEAIPRFLAFLQSLPSLAKVETIFVDFVEAQRHVPGGGAGWRMWDDLVIAAQMRRLELSEIYSNDADFDSISGIKRFFV